MLIIYKEKFERTILLNSFSDRLKNRIVQSDLDDPDNTPYGTPATYVNLISEHIINEFDFAAMSDTLCRYKHYRTVIGDVNLHFMHVEGSQAKSSTPILLLHGWPSTVWEFSKSLPLLIQQGEIDNYNLRDCSRCIIIILSRYKIKNLTLCETCLI